VNRVGFIIGIYHDAQLHGRQILLLFSHLDVNISDDRIMNAIMKVTDRFISLCY
jgi:hypothetical protein